MQAFFKILFSVVFALPAMFFGALFGVVWFWGKTGWDEILEDGE